MQLHTAGVGSSPTANREGIHEGSAVIALPLPHPAAGRTAEAEFISIPEWARRLGISSESAYKAARLNQIPGCFNIGRLYRVNWPVFVEATSSLPSGSDAGA
jgi:predicted DNA-binding transcriptional regulator AlpA